jgi:exonuclease VII large subunit
MATVYNKTALKKIKKDELIQMFLDQQAKLNDMQLSREVNQEQKNVLESYRELDKNYSIIVDKLQSKIDKMKNELQARAFTIIDLRNENEHLIKKINRHHQIAKDNKIKRQIKNWENPPDY